MKRVLIITYYWPPSGGSGVQRWLKMSKYLPENGWKPVIYTPEDGEYPVIDPSLEKDVAPETEVVRRPIVEPYTIYKKFLGIKKEDTIKVGFASEKKKSGWKERLSVWVRGNLFIPDSRCWWVKPSVRYLTAYLKEHPVDAIVSTGPPHSMHLIAMKLKEALGIPWIADFRDPWTEIDFYDELHLTKWADKKHHRMEREVLTKADKVVTVSWNWSKGLGRLGNRNVRVIQNGFDWQPKPPLQRAPLSEKFTLTHIGVIGPSRNTPTLWQVLQEIKAQDESFSKALKISLIGQVDQSVTQCLESCGLMENTEIIAHVSHDAVQQVQEAAQVLLLLVNNAPNAKGILTGKLYEYLSSGRPILCIGPEDGDAAQLLKETQAGTTIGFEDKEKMKEVVKSLYDKYLENNLPSNANASIEKYSRKALAGEYGKLLDKTIEEYAR
ncbi:MAG: glycosyltransferase family 4 protein [Bacteroidales bacterium]|nr:glycosyltransferase family 4 protein [Bacteroidales bacterium]